MIWDRGSKIFKLEALKGSDHTAKNTQVGGVDGPTRNLVIPEVLTSQEPLGGCITQQVTSQEILDVSR